MSKMSGQGSDSKRGLYSALTSPTETRSKTKTHRPRNPGPASEQKGTVAEGPPGCGSPRKPQLLGGTRAERDRGKQQGYVESPHGAPLTNTSFLRNKAAGLRGLTTK